jgi:hypothetical protein
MDLLKPENEVIDLYNALEAPDKFTLIDVGCSGGLDKAWLGLGRKLHCLGIDASVDEIEKLNEVNTHPGIVYVDALLCLPREHPFYSLPVNPSMTIGQNVVSRLSAVSAVQARSKSKKDETHEKKMKLNLWEKTRLSTKKVSLTDVFSENNISDIDFFKIDIDGPDFEVLQDLDGRFAEFGILGIGMEVNYFGDDSPSVHSFHNTDRFMRKNGYDLFGLSVHPYSVSALPSRFHDGTPAQTIFGRPWQGDALYIKDICNGSLSETADQAPVFPGKSTGGRDKLLNLLLLFSMFGLPDCAAELILKFKSFLENHIDTKVWLNALTKQAVRFQNNTPAGCPDYTTYMQKFYNDDKSFYHGANEYDIVLQQRNSLMNSRWRKLGQKLGIVKKKYFEK